MTGKTFLIGGGVAIAVAALYLGQRELRADVTESRDAPALAARARRPELAPRPAPIPHEVPAARGRAVEPAAPGPAPGARPKAPETPVEEFAHIHDAMERVFIGEPSDGAWAMDARRAVERALADLPVASRLRSIDCRSTMCRIETLHDSLADAQALALRFASPTQRPWSGGFYTGPIEADPRTGAVTVATYFVREGKPLPEIPDRGDDEPATR